MNRPDSHPHAIRSLLLSAMKTGEYSSCAHLPPEKELSEALHISRTQLRDALAALEREGFITRRHGIGTIINHHVLSIPCRMDIETEFLDMIRQSGFTPDLAFVRASEECADARTAERLSLAPGSKVLRLCRLCTADGKPAVYCEDIVPFDLIHTNFSSEDLQQPIFPFLQQFCSRLPHLDVTDLRPVIADEFLAALFQIPAGSPLLYMDETDYDADGLPVFISSQYFVDGIFRHTAIRKRF